MIPSAQLLSNFEQCSRRGFYARSYEPERLPAVEMVRDALRVSLTAQEQRDWGELAGSHVLQLAQDRGLDTHLHELYPSVMHHAALSDILVSSIRKPEDPAWLIPPVQNWTSACFLAPAGDYLRRIVLVSHWTEEREESETRNWYTLGELAHYNLPMQLIVFVIGQQRNGKRSSPWVKGFLHPQNKVLRFRRKDRAKSATFNEAWNTVLREDHAEISREKWLESMLKDDVLREAVFKIDVPIPSPVVMERFRGMAQRKLEALYATKEKPEANLSSCDWPVPCPFRKCCWSNPEREPSRRLGFTER